jgi:glutathione-regulated potassium-efflux system ancillary protein KefF
MILIIHAHPYPSRSRAGAALLNAVADLPDVKIHSLYQRYPDFDIDVAAEQAATIQARLVVWLTPLYWYSVPALMKHWIDSVLSDGFAFSTATQAQALTAEAGRQLCTKRCLWAVTTGGSEYAYSAAGKHEKPFAAFVAPLEQTARFCGMEWLPPHVVQDAHGLSDAALVEVGAKFRAALIAAAASC